MKNKEIAVLFDRIADALDIKGEQAFKILAYRKASRILDEMTDDVGTIALTFVAPLYVLATPKISVPVPALVTVPEPPMAPPKVLAVPVFVMASSWTAMRELMTTNRAVTATSSNGANR